MSGDLNIGAWIQFAKLTAAAGEMAPFPFIKGVAGSIATILEVVEQTGKNNEDLQDLAENIGTTIRIIKETVEAHGDTSATRFRDVCVDLQTYLESLIAELDTTRRKVKSKRIMQFLTTKKVSGIIDGYKQRVNDIRANYLVLVTTDSRLAMSEMQDALSATVESQAHCIQSEIRSLGDMQREHATRIYERLQNPTGYYKGQVRELFPGDIYITNPVSPSRRDSALEYQDRYGTVEYSSTAKIIRVYEHSPDNEEAILERFNAAADAFINIKHENIAQIFALCRSPNFPAIVFHGSTQIPFDDYERNLTAKQFIPFYIQLFYDLESVAEYLSRHSMFLCSSRMGHENPFHINEHGQVVMTSRIIRLEFIGAFVLRISNEPKSHVESYMLTDEPLPSQIRRWSSSLTSRKENLRNAYDVMKHRVLFPDIWPLSPPDRFYAPGSVLTLRGGTLVARIPTRLDEWDMRWKGSDSTTIEQLFHSTHKSGSITVPLPYTPTETYLGSIYLRPSNETLDSWIGQASQLQSSIRSKGHVEDDELSLIMYGDMKFRFSIDLGMHDSFRLCDTFMAEDHHALSLSIRAPSIEHQTNKMSFPVFTWYDGDLELSAVEVEESFGVVVEIKQYSWDLSLSKTVLTTIHELNADYGFDPARGGADVCEYFGWPLMEIWDISTGDWTPLHGTVVSEETSVKSGDKYRTSSESTESLPGNALEVEHTGEASTETEIATAVLTRDVKSSYGPLVFIVMLIVISVILLYFVVQAW